MFEAGLNNPLLKDNSSFDLDALSGLQSIWEPGYGDENKDGVPDHWNQELAPLHTNHRGYIGEDGNIYRKEITVDPDTGEVTREYTNERLYFWTPPQELGEAGNDQAALDSAVGGPQGFGAAGLYTKDEIQAAWNASEGMGYLKQHTTWDKYWSFVEQSTALFTDAEYNDMTDGNMTTGNWQDSPEYMALLAETGIPTQYINDDGDVFNFNGTTYVKDYKTDDSFDLNSFLKTVAVSALGAGAAAFFAPYLATAVGVSNSAAKTMITAALNIAKDGEIDIGTAFSLVGGPGGSTLGEMASNDDVLAEVIRAITDEITSPDNYGDNNEVVWGEIDYEGIEGEFDPDAPENPYDPDLIDPQLPQYPADEGGGTEPSDDAVADPSNDGAPSENEGQYEVIGKTDEGVIVQDKTDGDIYVIQGDYEIGDVIPESDMVDSGAGVPAGDPDQTNTEDASPQDGDPCFMEDGTPGVMRDGVCSLPSTTITVNPDVWGNDTDGDGQVDSESDNTEDTSTTTDIATPDPEVTTDNDGVSPGVLVVADDVWGTGSSGDGNTGTGNGNGNGNGDGNGDGNDGDDGNEGNSAGGTVSRGSSKTQWSPLYSGTKFRRFDKRARQGMMSQISQPNFSQDSRQNLYAGMFSDLMKGKA